MRPPSARPPLVPCVPLHVETVVAVVVGEPVAVVAFAPVEELFLLLLPQAAATNPSANAKKTAALRLRISAMGPPRTFPPRPVHTALRPGLCLVSGEPRDGVGRRVHAARGCGER